MHVDKNFIDYFLSPLIGGADDEDEYNKYVNINVDDEVAIKGIIKNIIKPKYESRAIEFKEIAKRSLSYYLTTDRVNFGRIYDSLLIAFDHPAEPKLFFIWLWEVLFENEDYKLKNWNDFNEIDDMNEPISKRW